MIRFRSRRTGASLWPLLAGLVIAGCAAPPRVAVPTSDSPISPDNRPQETARASASLLEQSRAQQAAGSYAEAAASIERALRIEPNNALLWIELGEIKLAEGDAEQAEMMARKALTLADRDRAVENRAYRLINR